MNLGDLIKQCGDFGRFQLILVFLILGARLALLWSMMMMAFAGVTPDWWCVPTDEEENLDGNVSLRDNTTYKQCTLDNITCTVVYSVDKSTIVNQWNLICGLDQNIAMITSVQMVGVLVGAFAGGQTSDIFGRKKTFYLTLLLGAASNIVAAFSVSWQMFTALRFFIGFSVGSYFAISYTYAVEFVGIKWRSVLSSLPIGTIGTGLFAFAAWMKPDWYYQHIFVGILHVPFLLGWFLVPDSLRWLAVKGRVEEAERVVEQMCRYNRRSKPVNTTQILEQVAQEEQGLRKSAKRYTYIDIYRGWTLFYKSVIIQFVWACMSLIFYGISFGAVSLSGNLYLNIFLLSAVDAIGVFTIHFLSSRIGRRWTCFMYLILAAISAIGVVLSSVYVHADNRGTAITVLALIVKLGISTGWGTLMMTTTEIYPTVIRNLGNGAANTMSRIGGIIAPYIFVMKRGAVFVPFLVVGALSTVCALLILLLGETKGKPLQDTMEKQVTSDGISMKSNETDGSQSVPVIVTRF